MDISLDTSVWPHSLGSSQYFIQLCLSSLAFWILFILVCRGHIYFSSSRDFLCDLVVRVFPFWVESKIVPHIFCAIIGFVDLIDSRLELIKDGVSSFSLDNNYYSKTCQIFLRYSVYMEGGEGTCPIMPLMRQSGEQWGEASYRSFRDDFCATSVRGEIN